MAIIAPSVLSADFGCMADQISQVEKGGGDWIHLDIMDGHFVPNITFGPFIIKSLRKLTDLPFDAHLMISNPDAYIEAFAQAGVNRLTVHYEACPHLWRTIDKIHEMNLKAGVTLNPATPVQLLEPVLRKVDLVLIMTVEPGFGGQKFIPQMLGKIDYLTEYKLRQNLDFHIQVDGGIDITTAPQVTSAGADVLVAGSAIFGEKDIAAAIQQLRLSIA